MKKGGWIVSPAPFILTRPTVSKMSLVTGITLVPQVVLLALARDTGALITIFAALCGSVLAEVCSGTPSRLHRLGDGTAILAGAIAGFLLPSTLNPVFTLAVVFLAFFVTRVMFGGSGQYWMSPVAVTVCVAWISNPAAFPGNLVSADGMQTVGNAFGALKMDNFTQIASDSSLTTSVNSGFLGLFGIRLPEGYLTLFQDSPSVIPAFRFNIVTLAASIILLAMDIVDWIVPACFLLTYSLCVWLLSLLPFTQAWTGGDILFSLLTSGTLFIAFYVLPEYTTVPRTRTGKVVSGVFAGLAAFALCGPGGSPAGGVFTVVVANALNPVIEYAENRHIAKSGDLT